MNAEARNPEQRNPDEELRRAAKKRLKAKRDFWNLIIIFAIITLILNAVWFFTGYREYYWPAWPMLGFTIAIFFTALGTFGPGSKPISEDAIEREMRKLRGQ